MQKLTTGPIRNLILAVLLLVGVVDIAALLYMSAFLGLLRTPLQALPPLYWVVLFIPVMVGFLCTTFIVSDSSRRSIVSSGNIPQYLVFRPLHRAIFGGVLSLILAFMNNLTKPQWGGSTALYLLAACISLIVVYAMYKQSQFLK